MKQKTPKKKPMRLPKHLVHLNACAAGIDVGSRSHFVAVPEGADPEPVREFSTFTDDLEGMADWLISCGVTTVAMESTGIYWIPVFEILESRGIEVKLVNARHVKNVPVGRATFWTASGCSSCIPTVSCVERFVLQTRCARFAPTSGKERRW